MSEKREEFTTLVNAGLLLAVRSLAEQEGRQVQLLVEEALSDLVDKHSQGMPRSHVLGVYLASHERYAPLYKKLAE